MTLLQRSDWKQRTTTLYQFPLLPQLGLVQSGPFQNQHPSARPKVAVQHPQVVNRKPCTLRAVPHVKMRRLVIAVEHGYHDPEKATDLRHGGIILDQSRAAT